ncbi:GGDEF domain-containing protein [Acidaminobacter sp. JC074]|uniref:tetratricopeptide repeat-containing diguanylate cyclase n=1 Tax=Acidaminobacter sp. JC074 TaxID=2530199 RepID=UPI001F114DCD|nr:GGDEF domain-containing protein [Acidaminobacter sp. JC074]
MDYKTLSKKIENMQDDIFANKYSLDELDQLIQFAEELDHVNAKLELLLAKGLYYYLKDDAKEAFEVLTKAQILATNLGNIESLVIIETRLGALYTHLGFFNHSFQLFMSALEKVTDNKLVKYLGPLNANIGTCLFKLDMIDEATNYTRKAYEIINNHDNTFHRYFINLNLANDLIKQGKHDEAKAYLSTAQNFIDEVDESTRFILAMTYHLIEAYQGYTLESSQKMNLLIMDKYNKDTHINHYDYVIEWCIAMDKNDSIDLAEKAIEHCLDCITEHDSIAKSQLMYYLAKIHEDHGNLEKSIKLYKESRAVQDRLYKKNQQFITENTLKILDLTRQVKTVMEESLRDTLTESQNRKALIKDAKSLLDQNKLYALLMFDIDFFKGYNDTYGHLKGDACIRDIINALSKILPEGKEQIYRYGGDEFIILLSEHVNIQDLVSIILNAVRDLQIEHITNKHQIATISIGASTNSDSREDLQSFIDHADMNLYTAKFKGRNCACYNGNIIR